MKWTATDTVFVARTLCRIKEHRTILRLGEGSGSASADALRIFAVHASFVVHPMIMNLYEGFEEATRSLLMVPEFLNASVAAGITACAISTVVQNRIFSHSWLLYAFLMLTKTSSTQPMPSGSKTLEMLGSF